MFHSSRLLVFTVLVAVSSTFLGCASQDRKLAEVPVPVNFKSEAMLKLQSVSHWNNVAIDMAAGVSKKYGDGNGCIPGYGCKTPLYVKENLQDTSFSKAFHTQLISALVNQGFPVMTEKNQNATSVDIDIQVVSMKIEYDQMPTELIDGVWVIRDINDTAVHKFQGLSTGQWSSGETNKNNWFKSPQSIPVAEMMVTVSFVNNGIFVARTSNMYYLGSTDGYVPVQASKTVAAMPALAASAAPAKHEAWTIGVVGDCAPARCYRK